MKGAEPQLRIKFGVTAYDESWGGYGDNRSREFATAEEAISYAKECPPNYRAHAWKQITMDPIHTTLWDALTDGLDIEECGNHSAGSPPS